MYEYGNMPPERKRKKSSGDDTLQDDVTKKRPDRAAKLKKRSEQSETVVKACLLKHLRGKGEDKEASRVAIRSRSSAYSRRIRAASLGLMHIIKQLFDGVQDIETMYSINVPEEFLEQTFFRQLMLGTSDAVYPHHGSTKQSGITEFA